MLHLGIQTAPQAWHDRPLPSELSRIPARAPWWAPALAFSALTDLRWQHLLEMADQDVLRNNLHVIGQSLASNTPLDLVVERSALDAKIIKSWICLSTQQVQRMTLEVTHRGCLRTLKSLRLPKPYQGLDFWGRFMLVVADGTEQAAFYGPFGTREKAAEFIAEHLESPNASASALCEVVEVVNPFADLLADADAEIADSLARAGASQGDLMASLMTIRSAAGNTQSAATARAQQRPRSASC